MGLEDRSYMRAGSGETSKGLSPSRRNGVLLTIICVVVVAVIGLQVSSQYAFPHRWNAMNRVLHADRVGWVGITWNGVDSVRTQKLGVPYALEISAVSDQSPGDKAGLLKNDLIVGINDKPFSSVMELQGSASTLQPGQIVTLNIVRSGEPIAVSITLCSWAEIKQLQTEAISL
jgi:S1-C subfamily serine protease